MRDSTIGAMVVCNSSEQAQAVHKKLADHGKFSAELVLSTIGYSDKELDDKRMNFNQGRVDILVVFQMLLTGFDAPRLKKLYLGRKIKEHNLLQALTRVNRPYGRMRYGYVVDFADIREEFDKTNQAYLQELREGLGDNFDSYQKIFKTQEEISADLHFVKDKLFQFNTDNAEEFRIQIQAIEDKKVILELRRAVELYKECYNLAEQYDYSELKAQFNVEKIFELSKVVNQRIQMLNQKAIWNNTDDMSALISLAVDDLKFNFRKVSEQELGIKDDFLNVRRETCREFAINADKKDPEYIALIEELRQTLERYNTEEMTASQMQNEQRDLDALRKRIHDLNSKNERLSTKYSGDKKFMRIHKRLSSQFSSPTTLYELLSAIKFSTDDKLLSNYSILGNVAYFARELTCDLNREIKRLSIPVTVKAIKSFAETIAQEYINERNAAL